MVISSVSKWQLSSAYFSLPQPAVPLRRQHWQYSLNRHKTMQADDLQGDSVKFSASPEAKQPTVVRETGQAETLGALFLHWMHHANGDKPFNETTSDEVYDRLEKYVQKHRTGFVRLHHNDVEQFLSRMNRDVIRKALNELKQKQRIVMNEHHVGMGGEGTGVELGLSLTASHGAASLGSVEDILMRHMPASKRLEREMEYQIRQGTYKPGDTIPKLITLGGNGTHNGEAVSDNVRNRAMNALKRRGWLNLTYVPTNTNGAHTNGSAHSSSPPAPSAPTPSAPIPSAPIQGTPSSRSSRLKPEKPVYQVVQTLPNGSATALSSTVSLRWFHYVNPILLYHLVMHPDLLKKGASVTSSQELHQYYGHAPDAFTRAKQAFATRKKGGFMLRQAHHLYKVDKRPSAETLRSKLRQSTTQLDHSIEGFLAQLDNTHRQRVWQKTTDLMPLMAFPKSIKTQASQERMITSVMKSLEEKPAIPLIFRQTGGRKTSSWLNPALNFEHLKHDLNVMQKDLPTLASSIATGIGLWQSPRLFLSQTGAIPTVQSTHHQNHFDLNMGLTFLDSGQFSPLPNLLPVLPVTTPPSAEAGLPPLLDMKDFGNRSLQLMKSFYPLGKLDQLSQQPLVHLTPSEHEQMKKVAEPLSHLGYRFQLAP